MHRGTWWVSHKCLWVSSFFFFAVKQQSHSIPLSSAADPLHSLALANPFTPAGWKLGSRENFGFLSTNSARATCNPYSAVCFQQNCFKLQGPKKNTNRIIFLIPKLKNAQQTLWKFVSVNMSRACGYNAALMWRQWGMAEFWEEAADLSFWDCWVPSSLVQYSERICAVEENWEQERREMIYLNWRGYSIFHCYELLVPQLSVS